jgi:hypothetical protein
LGGGEEDKHLCYLGEMSFWEVTKQNSKVFIIIIIMVKKRG